MPAAAAMTVTFFDRGDLANPLNGSELDSVLDLELALRGPAEVGIYSVIYSLGDKIMQLVTVPLPVPDLVTLSR